MRDLTEEAKDALYAWEQSHGPMSDDERNVWLEAYVIGHARAVNKFKLETQEA